MAGILSRPQCVKIYSEQIKTTPNRVYIARNVKYVHNITMTSHERNVCLNHLTVCLKAYMDPHQRKSKSALLALYERNSSVTGEFPTQRAGNAGKSSSCWRHHDIWHEIVTIHWFERAEFVFFIDDKETLVQLGTSGNIHLCTHTTW